MANIATFFFYFGIVVLSILALGIVVYATLWAVYGYHKLLQYLRRCRQPIWDPSSAYIDLPTIPPPAHLPDGMLYDDNSVYIQSHLYQMSTFGYSIVTVNTEGSRMGIVV